MQSGREGSNVKESDLTGFEADDVEDLYRMSKVQCGVMCREVART